MFFQQVMCFDNDQRSGGFKTNPSLDTDNGIAHMNIPSDRKRLRNGLQILYGPYRMIKFFIIYRLQFSLFKMKTNFFWPCFSVSGVGHASSGR